MTIIVGLGNPGKRYEWTRHNLGWLALDAFVAKYGGSWEKHHKAEAQIAKVAVNGVQALCVKPQTFMNESGRAVASLLSFYGATSPIVVHDDIDLPLGTIRISQGASAAGHNGVKSIIQSLGTQDFLRLRLGIRGKRPPQMPTDKYVLAPFSFWEKRQVKKGLPRAIDAIECLLAESPEQCMNRFN